MSFLHINRQLLRPRRLKIIVTLVQLGRYQIRLTIPLLEILQEVLNINLQPLNKEK